MLFVLETRAHTTSGDNPFQSNNNIRAIIRRRNTGLALGPVLITMITNNRTIVLLSSLSLSIYINKYRLYEGTNLGHEFHDLQVPGVTINGTNDSGA